MLQTSVSSYNKVLAIVVIFFISLCISAPISTNTEAKVYLTQYGYLKSDSLRVNYNDDNGESLRNAISDFQNFTGLSVSGELNNETIAKMSLPRCGVTDKNAKYVIQGSKWSFNDITYKISTYPRNSHITRKDVDKEIQRAFDVWSQYTDLTFTQNQNGKADIDIRFESGEHGCGDAFDGDGGVLAHAYFPEYYGTTHFDDDEQWTANSMRGTNLFQVAAHEFGHALGLSHSNVDTALMAPFYVGFNPSFQLDIDDINGIQYLYGKKTQKDIPKIPDYPVVTDSPDVPIYPPGPSPQPGDNLSCSDPKFDTIFTNIEGETFIFKGLNYYKVAQYGTPPSDPQPISSKWHELPGDIDAAFTHGNGRTYFFKGSKFWRFSDTHMDSGYPKHINEQFNGIPDSIDTAFYWRGNGKIYFFKGDKFWPYDSRHPRKAVISRSLSNWNGIPKNIDSAFQNSNGYIYFFKDDMYYRFDYRTFSVEITNPPFPRLTAHWWLGCNTSGSNIEALDDLENYIFYEKDAVGPEENYDEITTSSTITNISNGSFQTELSSLSIFLLGVILLIRHIFYL